MCVARRSRNQRSWLTTTAQPAKLATASSSARSVSTSRSFVGSSSKQHVRAAAQQLGQVDAVPLAAGEDADFLLLVGAGEVEPRDVGPRVHLAAAHFERVVAAGDFLVHGVVGHEVVAALIDVAELDRRADLQLAVVRLLLAHEHAEQRRLAGAVGADDADDAAGRQAEVHVLEDQRGRRTLCRG